MQGPTVICVPSFGLREVPLRGLPYTVSNPWPVLGNLALDDTPLGYVIYVVYKSHFSDELEFE